MARGPVDDRVRRVFIRLQNKGTVLTGQLEGDGALRPGDYLITSFGGLSYKIVQIEKFREICTEVRRGANIGLALGPRVPPEGFDSQRLTFRRC